MPAVRLVASPADINGLRIDEEAALTDKETEPVRQALARRQRRSSAGCWPSGASRRKTSVPGTRNSSWTTW